MTKLMLVSDYDGTLKSNVKNLKINIETINRFREQGNLFTISTGRNYCSIKKECKKYNINYDYLFCNNGRVLFDQNDKIIYKKNLDIEFLKELNTIITDCYGIKAVKYYNSYRETNLTFDNSIIEVFIKLNIVNNLISLKEYFETKYPDINILKYFIYTWIKQDMDKSKGLEILTEILSNEILKENIITIGNNYNDLTMLKNYKGYKILLSYPFLYGQGLKTTKEVHTLIKRLEKCN